MSNNLYDILSKLQSLEPAPERKETKPVLTESSQTGNKEIIEQLNEKYTTWKSSNVREASKPDYIDLDKDGNKKEPMKKAAKDAKAKKINEDLQADDGRYYKNADDFFSTIEADWLDQEVESDDGMEVRGYIDGVNVMAFRYDNESKTSGYGIYDDSGLLDEGMKSWMRDPQDPESKIPAFQRKNREAGKQAGEKAADDMNKKAGVKVFKSGRADEGTVTYTKTGLTHKGSYGTDYQGSDDDSDDDYDEWGNKKTGAKKSTDAEPKKRGRPAKNKGPERVTSKAWKHKGGRVGEAINLDTFVEDAMAELEGVFVTEKAVSKAQQKFMGMVHAAQKGEKPASKEVAKAAKSMSKKDAKDFAKTKHKGLPDRVDEGRTTLVENSLQAIVRKFGKEVRDFAQGGNLDNDLFDALYDYYFDDMPYGVKKARDGDPYEWISQHFDDAINRGDVEITESNLDVTTEAAMELDELARLAGLGEVSRGEYIKQQDARAERSGHDEFKAFGQLFKTDQVQEAACNQTAEGVECPVHGMVECGSMMEGAKPDYIDLDKDGNKKESMKKAADDAEENKVDECMSPMGSMPMDDNQTGMSINASLDTKTGRKTVTVTAEGEAAEQLAQMLKMAGLSSGATASAPVHVHTADEVQEEFANEPEEAYADTKAIIDQGDDMHRQKVQDPATANRAANPLKVDEDTLKLEGRLAAMYNSLKVKTK